jgi:hypothetical protein
MATTTNYGWTTPDDTALVKDGASAIRSLGTSVDTTTKNLNPSTTLGDIEYRSSTANTNTRLGIGSTGQVLTVAGGVPTWAAAAGGGKVLQIVQGTTTTSTNIASTTFTDTNLSATITPSSNTSKILILIAQTGYAYRATNTAGMSLKLLRNSTDIYTMNNISVLAVGATTVDHQTIINGNYLDSPATTSAITYKTQGKTQSTANSGSAEFQTSSATSIITLLEIGA